MSTLFNLSMPPYNAALDGITDDTLAIQAAITAAGLAGGGIVYGAGIGRFSAPLALSQPGVILAGPQGQGFTLKPLPSFAGANLVNITADYCGLTNVGIVGASNAYGSNPAADGIQFTGARSCILENVWMNYINGWAVQSTATAGVANTWTVLTNVHNYQCKAGIHLLGNTGSSYAVSYYLMNCFSEQVQNGDGYLFEDARDILCVNLLGSVTAGSGNALHIKGACQSIYASTIDLGPATGACALLDSSPNGTPKQIVLSTGALSGGLTGLTVNAATQLHVMNCDIYQNATHGITLGGAGNTIVGSCIFNLNGITAGAGRYDFQSNTTGHVEVNDCLFMTAQGANSAQTNNAVNVTAGAVTFQNDTFIGVGYTPANIFNGLPAVIRDCPGYNPVGNVSLGTIGASPYTFPVLPTTTTYIFTGGTFSVVSIGGVATGLVGTPSAASPWMVRVPAQQTLAITYSVAPVANTTVLAFSD